MANTGFKGIDVRQTGVKLIFRVSLKDSAGADLITGTTTLVLYELQDDGTYKSYDFSDNTFKTTALTTETLAMTHRTGNNGATNTGLWTAILATLTGFTVGAIYTIKATNTGASPVKQEREFQFGSAEGDLVVGTDGYLHVNVKALNDNVQSAINLSKSAGTMYVSTVTGATTNTTLIDSTLTQSGIDHWEGRTVIVLTGALAGQKGNITGFDPTTDKLTFEPMSAALSIGDGYIIV